MAWFRVWRGSSGCGVDHKVRRGSFRVRRESSGYGVAHQDAAWLIECGVAHRVRRSNLGSAPPEEAFYVYRAEAKRVRDE